MIQLNSTSTLNLSLNDINELASDIGKECERLIATYGIDNANEIVSKCITALQMLEKLSNEREKAIQEVSEMQEKISALEKGKLHKVESQKAYEKDLESIEEIWNSESDELRSRIRKLQEENKKLLEFQNKSVEKSLGKISDTSIDNITGSLYAEEYKMNIKLKEQIKKFEVELKMKQNEIEVKDLEIRDLTEEIDELRQSQKQMRRQSRAMETQVKTLYEEREEILAEMQDQHKTFLILRDHLGMASLENEDLAFRQLNDSERPRFTLNDMNNLISERTLLLEKIEDLEKEIKKLKSKDDEQHMNCNNSEEVQSESKFKKL